MTNILSHRDRAQAQKRAKNRAKDSLIVREELRAMIDGFHLLKELTDIARQLQQGTETVLDGEGERLEMPMGRERTSSLKAAADVKLSLLRKVLPDLKAVELTGADGSPLAIPVEVNPLELLTRIRAYDGSLAGGGDGGQGDGAGAADSVRGEPEPDAAGRPVQGGEDAGSETLDVSGGPTIESLLE